MHDSLPENRTYVSGLQTSCTITPKHVTFSLIPSFFSPVSAVHWACWCSVPEMAMPLSQTNLPPSLCTLWCPSEEHCTPNWQDWERAGNGIFLPQTHKLDCHVHVPPPALGDLDQTSSTGKEQRLSSCNITKRRAAEIGITLISSSRTFLNRKNTKE